MAEKQSPTLPMSSYSTKPSPANKIQLVLKLDASSWVNGIQTIEADGVTSTNLVIVSPTPNSFMDYLRSTIRCSSQSLNSLTFRCEETPTSDIYVNVVITK